MNNNVIEIRNHGKSAVPVEAFKTLCTNLLYTDDLQVLTVTSISPDEGKTVTAFNLAKSFAEMNKKVCLVDCDLRRSTLKSYLMVSNQRTEGITEVLTKQARECIYPTNINNLYVILSGKKAPNPTELLTGNSFDKVLLTLKNHFDYVIIDTPPATVAMDAAIVGRKSDGVLLVVRNEVTKKKTVKRVVKEIDRNGGRVVGVVLNRVKKNQMDYNEYGYDKYY